VHGRIWTHLFLSSEPLDAGELIERLGISKALVSMTISDLLDYDVIQVAGKGPRSTVTYRANPDVTTVISNILRKRERRMLGRVSSAARQLKDLPEDARGSVKLSCARLETLTDMVRSAETALDAMLQLSNVSFESWSSFNETPDKKK
jgi:DNA-binding transcriptional regulator GbsR (MarR family)